MGHETQAEKQQDKIFVTRGKYASKRDFTVGEAANQEHTAREAGRQAGSLGGMKVRATSGVG